MSYPPPPQDPQDEPTTSGSTPPPPPPPPPPYGSTPPPYGAEPGYGAPPPTYPPGYPTAPGGYAMPSSNQKATWAMILGIVGLLCCFIASIAAIILGQQAKNEIAASGGAQSGAGQAQAGVIMGIIGCALAAVGILAWIALVAAGSA